MTVRELLDLLNDEDPEAVVVIDDGWTPRHIKGSPTVEPFTLSFRLGGVVTEEDLT